MARVIKLNHITKIEGHASLTIKIENGTIVKCELQSVEGSRYFEGMLKGRRYDEASEISSRICGICSCGHTICAIQAVEDALGIKPTEQTVNLRKLLTIAERIRSHATHLYFLALPDYTGYESALAMASKYKKEVQRALNLMKIGNEMVKIIGGRDLHPVSATVGGFLKVPNQDQINYIKDTLKKNKKETIETAKLFGNLEYPKFDRFTEWFSLTSRGSYPLLHGSITSQSHGFEQKDYKKYLDEYHEHYGTSNFVVKNGKAYMVGALSRINNNFKYLSKDAKKVLNRSKIKFPNNNPFINNFAQAIELIHFFDRAIEICSKMKVKKENIVKPKLKKGQGIAAIEVPRGTLWHEYEINEKGEIEHANIITPTCQNLRSMEEDIRHFLPSLLHLPKEKIVLDIEKLIRSYDPCFSCSTHFLKVKWE